MKMKMGEGEAPLASSSSRASNSLDNTLYTTADATD
jgi:hypothetical protein